MKLFKWAPDGGPNSPVRAFFLIEWKKGFSIALLRFNVGGREAYHSHAFNAYTWFLTGDMVEDRMYGPITPYKRRLLPKRTPRDCVHRVRVRKTGWCLTVRGPWTDTWDEYNRTPDGGVIRTTLAWGRKIVRRKVWWTK